MEIIGIKSNFKETFLKLATNDRSDKMFLLTLKFCLQGVGSPCPGAIYMYKIMKQCIKSDFTKFSFLKLVANNRSDKRFLLTSKFCPQGLSAQADLSLHWAHMPFCWFFHEAAHYEVRLKKNQVSVLQERQNCLMRYLQ